MPKIRLVIAVLVCAAATTACSSQVRQSVLAGQEIKQNTANVYGKSKTRAEVNADLALWKRAGLDKFWRGRSPPDTFRPEYRAAYAEYVRLRSGTEYQQEVQRQSAK
ncbi:hypothetical protein CR155_16305 [Pollutimonas nitritireducens]|uniref:DUF4148 domain-containing protein n=1 Tax=Pollutimonas nitritireducens TaxID=2045209 RepID=A0A2N4UD76_9BURK|nr:DUF4148 domain-containing protein [Pollutimonas nitritireducens]PLC52962.1 hypothetical protein CR155_16305 [Pollutimonas nitritireducens]